MKELRNEKGLTQGQLEEAIDNLKNKTTNCMECLLAI